MASTKRYFGLSWAVCLILTIIAPIGWICGTITRLQRGNILGAILCLILYYPIFWVIDLVTMVTAKDITVLA